MDTPPPLYHRIGDVCRQLRLPAHVLRAWEKEFPDLCPRKTPSGHRLYQAGDIGRLRRIRDLVYTQGYTLSGARQALAQAPTAADDSPAGPGPGVRRLLEEALDILARWPTADDAAPPNPEKRA